MSADNVRNRLLEICSHMTFEYRGVACGIDPLSHDCFDVWCGEKVDILSSIDEVMNTKFFMGNSLAEISGVVDFIDW